MSARRVNMRPRRKNILVTLGTRPEAIKLAPVLRALRRRRGLRVRVCVTAQHRELLDQILGPLMIRPDIDLDLMRRDQAPDALAERVLRAFRRVLDDERPDLLVVQGDTTTAAAAAWAACYRRVPVAHVEAGLRSFDPMHPFPEERNRVLIDHLSTLLFAPTRRAEENLLREGVARANVFVTGNTAVDALAWAMRGPARGAPPRPDAEGATILVTLHRRESFGRPLESIFEALLEIVRRVPEARIVYPVHPNPNVRAAARRLLRHERVRLLPPMPYLDFIGLLGRCRLVLTDSGGLQEEAACLRKPVLVVREATDRPEILEAGGGMLVGREPRRIVRAALRLLRDRALYKKMARSRNPFGDGRAAERIASAIERRLARTGSRAEP
ncbi:MAG: UDP-N-acetylglucosamine 2-epimerase (non-hydrolyzing) [Elusimicrobiota bacterium]